MATINYKFADGHFEEIEVTEEFKREYEFLLIQENAQYWKIKKQKQRAGLEVKYDLSLDRLSEDGYELSSFDIDPLEQLIEEEEKQEYYNELLEPLTVKQREVFILHYIKGFSKVQIAALLNIDESSVRERLSWAQKKILNNFLKHPRF